MSDVQRRTVRGAAWMVLARLADRTLGLASTLILARLLAPDDFGLIAMAMSFIAMLGLLRAFGLDVVLIQHRDPTRVHYDSAWTMNILVSMMVAAILLMLAQPAALFYREPDLPTVMALLALSPLIESFRNIGVVDFRRDLQFDKEFRYLFATRLSRFVVTVPLALYLQSYWALVIGMLTGTVADVALSYAMHPYRPRFSLGAARELFGFSKWLVFKNLVQLLIERSGEFVIGRVVGTRALGLFNVSNDIALIPSAELAAPINRALLPGYAKEATDTPALRATFLNVVSMLSLVTLPLGVGVMLLAHLAVPILLGANWLDAIPLVPILALNGLLMSLGSNTGTFLLATGRARATFGLALVKLAVLVPSLLIGANQAGEIGAAWGYVLSSLVVIPVAYSMILFLLEIRLREFLARVWRPVLAVGLMTLAVRWGIDALPVADGTVEQILQAGLLASVGGATYGSAALLLWFASGRPSGAEKFILDRVMGRLRDLGAR